MKPPPERESAGPFRPAHEPVPDRSNRGDETGLVRGITEGSAYRPDVDVHHALVAEEVGAPDLLEQLGAGEDCGRVRWRGHGGGRTPGLRTGRRGPQAAPPGGGGRSRAPRRPGRPGRRRPRRQAGSQEDRGDPRDYFPSELPPLPSNCAIVPVKNH